MKVDESLELTHSELKKAIEILKRSNSTMVDLDSIQCPIRKLIGQSREDIKMIKLKNELEHRGIVERALGHWSLAHSREGHLYFTSFFLNEEWFKKNCITHRYDEHSKQFQLF